MKQSVFLFALLLTYLSSIPQAFSEPERVVFSIAIKSSINPGTADFIETSLAKAKAEGGEALVIELDTPGGLLDSTRTIVQALLNSDLPVVVYVSPRGGRAGSAGVFITLAAHVAVMAPGTNIGAAHPITAGGKDPEESGGKHLAKKVENDTVAFIETIAHQRQRNIAWAREAVLQSVSITDEKALEQKVIDLIATNRQDLLRQLDGRAIKLVGREVRLATKDAKVVELDMSLKQGFLDLLSNPNVVFFLIVIAMLGIYMELSHPGAVLPGVAAALAIILILLTSQSLPFNMGGVLLLLLGGVFFILEAYVTSYGMLALGGVACFVLGSIFLFDVEKGFGVFGIANHLIALTAALLGGFAVFTGYFIMRSRRVRVSTGAEGMIGQVGEVASFANGIGRMSIAGEDWRFTLEPSTKSVQEGDRVRVVAADSLILRVEPIIHERN